MAFSKIEDIAQRLYDVICRIDKEKMKRETMDMLKNFFLSRLKIEHLSSWNCVLQIADFFSTKGQECLVDNVITVGFCFLQAIPEDIQAKQELLFKLIDGKECKWVKSIRNYFLMPIDIHRVIEEIENCMMGGIDSCEEKTVSQIFRMLFNFSRNELSCVIKEEVKI